MKEAPLLRAVDRIIGRIQIEDDRRRGHGMRPEKIVIVQIFLAQRQPVDPLAHQRADPGA